MNRKIEKFFKQDIPISGYKEYLYFRTENIAGAMGFRLFLEKVRTDTLESYGFFESQLIHDPLKSKTFFPLPFKGK